MNAKDNTITDRGGTGSVLLENGVLSRIYGDGDIDVSMSLNLNDSSDPTNFNIKVDGSVLKNKIATLQNGCMFLMVVVIPFWIFSIISE